MQLRPVIRTQQKQSLVITPQLQQAIKLLQMTNLEIQAFLDDQALENPFLDIKRQDERQSTDAEPAPVAPAAQTEAARDLTQITAEQNGLADDPTAHTDVENRYSSLDMPMKPSGTTYEGDDYLMRLANPEDGLHQMISNQIDISIAVEDRPIAYMLTDLLSPSGWLDTPLDEIAKTGGMHVERLESVLTALQTLEPAGIFARDLAECLKLQALDHGDYDAVMAVVLGNIELLGKGEIAALARLAACDEDDIIERLRLIRGYNPKPGESYSNDLPALGEPDVVVRQTDKGWAVDLNRSTLPTIHIKEDYADEIARKLGRTDKAGNGDDFVGAAIGSARWLRRALEQRNTTTLKICSEIIRLQQDFLSQGMEALKPMSLKTIAEAVGMHESTVSRVTNGTVINTPRGTFKLKALFSVSIATDEDESGMAASAVRDRIKTLISNENPNKPLSDHALADSISDQGIKLARRTVAKYREMMRIPSSSERRRLARMKLVG